MIVLIPRTETHRAVIDISEDGLTFRDIKRKTFCQWESITHIFRWSLFNLLVVIDVDGNVSIGNAYPDSTFRKSSEKVKYIWNVWRNKILDAQDITKFEYSRWCRRKELPMFLSNAILGVGFGLCVIGLTVYIFATEDWEAGAEFRSFFALIAGVMLSLYALGFGIHNLLEHLRKKLREISLLEDGLQVVYDNGAITNLDINKIRKYHLENPRNIGTLIFEDGTKLRNLDRLSHWVILREYLLSKLEPKERA